MQVNWLVILDLSRLRKLCLSSALITMVMATGRYHHCPDLRDLVAAFNVHDAADWLAFGVVANLVGNLLQCVVP